MPSRIARQLQETAKKCRELARSSKDVDVTAELERIAADIDAKARSLDDIYAIVEAI